MFSSFVSLGKFIPTELTLFVAMVNGIDSLISLSDFSLFLYRDHLHFYILTMKNQKEIKESIPFIIATKIIKYLGINLPKETKELYTEIIRH